MSRPETSLFSSNENNDNFRNTGEFSPNMNMERSLSIKSKSSRSFVFKISPHFNMRLSGQNFRKSMENQKSIEQKGYITLNTFHLSPVAIRKTPALNFRIGKDSARKSLESRESNKGRPLTIQGQSNEIDPCEDMKPKEIIGKYAPTKFYKHYKKLDKVADQNKFTASPDSVYTAFLKKTESLNLLPSKIGFIKAKGEESKITLSHFSIGDKYAEVLSEGLKSMSTVSSLELANNRLSSKGADLVLSNLSKNAQIINLANNKIGSIGCSHIASLLVTKSAKIIELNLEGNLLGDAALKPLFEAISSNNSIKKLNISKNYLSNISADRIAKMIEYNSAIEEFYLKWNQINSGGGACILKGIMASISKIKVLDLSWNAFSGHNAIFAQTFAEFIANNDTLVHLDLSHNNFAKEESKIISEALEKNHTLYGIHYDGNYGYIDPRGYLRLIDVPCEKLNVNYVTHQIRGVTANAESKKHTISESGQYKECCWICEGWSEVEFRWRPSLSGVANDDPIYIHLHYEGYRNIFLPSEDNFYQTRMCPPGKIEYFFTADKNQVIAEDQPKFNSKDQIIKFQIDNASSKTRFDNLNFSTNKFNANLFDPITYNTTCKVLPRTPDKQYQPVEVSKERIPWTFQISIFREYKSDTEEIIRKCFEVDFENTRIPKFVKKPEELAEVKELLREVYKYIKECYRYYASVGVVSDIWCVHQAEINELCRQANLKDPNFLDEKELGLLSIKTYTKGADSPFARNPRNPDRALVRYQLLEFILRVAEECIVNKGYFKSYPEAVKAILEEKILPHAKTFDFHKFRIEKYWNEKCDAVYKTYLPIVQSVYRRYSGMKTKPGHKKFMCLEELFNLVNDAELLDDNLVDRDISVCFNVSMMTQVDELTSDRIYQMTFIEYLECLARIADIYSAANIGENQADIPYQERFLRPLHYKLEGIIAILFYRCVETIISETLILPEKSIFDWSIEEQRKAAKVIGKKRTIVMIDPVSKTNVFASAE